MEANSIDEKLGCAATALIVDVFVYSLLIYAVLRWREKRREMI
jgi:hypothetical protein